MSTKQRKLLFSAYSLNVGGIEKALVTLVNSLEKLGYDITLVLEKKQGIFLNDLNSNIHIIEYRPSQTKNMILRKVINFVKRINFIIKYKNKYDFSACFATYSIPSSFTSRTASKNCALWGHADYLTVFNNDEKQMKSFFENLKYNEFKNIIFVSKEGMESFIKIFPQMKKKVTVCNNLIDFDMIKKLSNYEIDMVHDDSIITFLNVGRHDEKQKKLSRIIEAAKLLKNDNLNFKVLFVGEGQDTEYYKDLVIKEKLDKYIIFLGSKKNPYPFFKISDCVLLTSDYEGYPVVFLESFVLNKPIITTKVSDYSDVDGKYGYVAEKDVKDIYEKMKLFIKDGYQIKEKFDSNKYNENIIHDLEKFFEG